MTATSDNLVTRLYSDNVPFEMFNYTGRARYDRTAHTHYCETCSICPVCLTGKAYVESL